MAKSKNTSLNPAITALTGDALRAYAAEMNAIALGKRKFVDDIVQYMNESKPKHCLVLVGLKGTGKTTGLLQAIAALDAFDDTVLLTVAADVTVSREDMKTAIKVLGADAR